MDSSCDSRYSEERRISTTAWRRRGPRCTISGMDSSSCAECRAIHRELQEALAAAKVRPTDQHTTPKEIATWVQQLNEDQCTRMRAMSSLWAIWRRWEGASGSYGALVVAAAGAAECDNKSELNQGRKSSIRISSSSTPSIRTCRAKRPHARKPNLW